MLKLQLQYFSFFFYLLILRFVVVRSKKNAAPIVNINALRRGLKDNTVYQLAQRENTALVECADPDAASSFLNSPPGELSGLSVELVSLPNSKDLTHSEQLLCSILDPTSAVLRQALRRDWTLPPHKLHSKGFAHAYVANSALFDSLCQSINSADDARRRNEIRAALPAVHGTPGLGKSALLDHLADCVTNYQKSLRGEPLESDTREQLKLLRNARNWPECSVLVSVTFNNQSIYE